MKNKYAFVSILLLAANGMLVAGDVRDGRKSNNVREGINNKVHEMREVTLCFCSKPCGYADFTTYLLSQFTISSYLVAPDAVGSPEFINEYLMDLLYLSNGNHFASFSSNSLSSAKMVVR